MDGVRVFDVDKWNWWSEFKFHPKLLHSLYTNGYGKSMNPSFLLRTMNKRNSRVDWLLKP